MRNDRQIGGHSVRRLMAGVLLVLLVSACTTNSTSPGLSPTPTTSPGLFTPVPTDPGASPASPSPAVTAPGQTDTDWGRIWDDLPPAFPAYPGASPTEAGAGPASATLDVGDVEPAEVGTYYRSALEAAGFSTVSLSGAREDGSVELESAGDGDCRARVTATPLGGTTIVTILYGSACPFD